jgi:predicted unusual protein kinase regulating ubiquinone biosynthesis (AarF/ABC1/UbiB family)
MGFFTIDFIPVVVDVLILKFLFGVLNGADKSKIDVSVLPNTYNKTAINDFYLKQPGLVIVRTFEMAKEFQAWIIGNLLDVYNDELQKNMPIRAKEFARLVSALGPAFIKVGQSVSLRPDLCPPAYLEELTKLQDQVPPFDSKVALGIIEEEVKGPASSVFEDVSVFDTPLAAASLGQVYRARVKSTGEDVAVKVQRPNVKLTVTLDIFITRGILDLTSKALKDIIPGPAESCGALVGVIDAWAGRFVDELDYRKEIENCERFRVEMANVTTLGDAIVVPKADLELSSDRILVSEWVDGTKLSRIDVKSESGKDLVRGLTRVLLNAYLVQLLETGFLHADPRK